MGDVGSKKRGDALYEHIREYVHENKLTAVETAYGLSKMQAMVIANHPKEREDELVCAFVKGMRLNIEGWRKRLVGWVWN